MLLVGVTIITVYHLCVSVCDSDGEFVLHGGVGGEGVFYDLQNTCKKQEQMHRPRRQRL